MIKTLKVKKKNKRPRIYGHIKVYTYRNIEADYKVQVGKFNND